ncbi:hypothetical protein CIAN88_08790 [[Clostridium] innocuum]|uniref:Uncharacterized protein n=1 Tax=Clostridium innocuum TaxID=1522 RepID=A0A099I6C3_CLOIN|nr:hypothetical protein [[Clostridium] innocuum]KGJ53504.1 hypothetical protein CIAN88_08790 [[Clostridium] innocuum]
MRNITKEQLESAYKEIVAIIRKCEHMEGKFAAGTSQHTLLENRLFSMRVAKQLIEEKLTALQMNTAIENANIVSLQELASAIEPVRSIIRKCRKAQSKYEKETAHYNRHEPMIHAMQIAEQLLEEQHQLQQEAEAR